jgi:hypothetical protein
MTKKIPVEVQLDELWSVVGERLPAVLNPPIEPRPTCGYPHNAFSRKIG